MSAPNFARRVMAWLWERGAGDETAFPEALGRALAALTRRRVASGNWRLEAVDSYLRPISAVIERRKEVGRGEDLVALKTRLSTRVASRLTRSVGRVVTTGRIDWDFGKLPPT